MFKCRFCHCKYEDDFCSDDDVGVCRWCSGEEEEWTLKNHKGVSDG